MISVCVVLYNNEKFIEDLFNSLLPSIGNNDEVVFWDNNSTDKTAHILEFLIQNHERKHYLRLIKNNDNRGYAYAVNECVVRAKYPEILLVNPNSIVNKKSLKLLESFYQKHKTSIVAGRYVGYEGGDDTQPSGVESASFLSCILQLTNLGKLPVLSRFNSFWIRDTASAKNIDGVSAGFTLFSKKTFKRIGGFNTEFFMYLEDLDFCMRAKEKKISVYFVPKATLQHFGGGSSIDEPHHIQREHWVSSRETFFRTQFYPLGYLIFKLVDIIERHFRLV